MPVSKFIAFRPNRGKPLYVQEIRKHGVIGDKYSYTGNSTDALHMTGYQAKVFKNYMKDCLVKDVGVLEVL